MVTQIHCLFLCSQVIECELNWEKKISVNVTQSVKLSRKWVRVTLKVHRFSKWVIWIHIVGQWVLFKCESCLNVSLVYKWVRLASRSGSCSEKGWDSWTESSWLIFLSVYANANSLNMSHTQDTFEVQVTELKPLLTKIIMMSYVSLFPGT